MPGSDGSRSGDFQLQPPVLMGTEAWETAMLQAFRLFDRVLKVVDYWTKHEVVRCQEPTERQVLIRRGEFGGLCKELELLGRFYQQPPDGGEAVAKSLARMAAAFSAIKQQGKKLEYLDSRSVGSRLVRIAKVGYKQCLIAINKNNQRDRLAVFSATCGSKRGKSAKLDRPLRQSQGGKRTAGDPVLGERARLALVALLRERAVDSDHRITAEKLAVSAVGATADANQYKAVVVYLKELGYVDTRKGRGGGCWLTPAGKARAEKVESK